MLLSVWMVRLYDRTLWNWVQQDVRHLLVKGSENGS